jgi:phage gp36-like protein
MVFLTQEDFKAQIKADVLTRIIQDDASILHQAEMQAIKEMQSYLGVRLDVANIFNRSGSERHPLIVMFCVDILLYHVHSRLNPNQIPQLRMDRYDAAVKWCKDTGSGTLFTDLPTRPEPETTTAAGNIIYSGDVKRNNRF